MEVSEYLASLGSEEPLNRRSAAKALSDLAESTPSKFTDEDIGAIVGKLREEEDTLTTDHLLEVIDCLSKVKSNYLVSIGALRVLLDVFMKNMGGIGINVGRDAMRLISYFAATDKEGVEKLNLIGFILRTLAGSKDPYIRWYATIGLRKVDPSLIQKEAEEITAYSVNAMEKENDEKTRVAGALILTLVATVAPEAFAGSKIVDFLVKTLLADSSSEVQSCVALTLQFVARKDPSQFKDTKAAEALFKTLIGKLETLENTENRVQREILVTVATTISILALKDPSVLAGGRAIEQADLGEVIAKSMEKTEEESEIRSILMSALVDLSRGKASDYINNKDLLEVLLKLLEGSTEEDANYRSALQLLSKMASAYPSLFSGSTTLKRLASLAVERETAREKGQMKSKLAPADVFGILWQSEKGSEILIDNMPQMYEDSPDLIGQLLKLDSLKYVQAAVMQRRILKERKQKPVVQPAVEEVKPAQTIAPARTSSSGATESLAKAESPKPKGLTEKQKNLLQEMFRTQAEIALSELAKKLDVSEGNITEALSRLISSGKLPYRIQGGILYLKKPPQSPAEILAAEGVQVSKGAKKAGAAKCIWCGARLNLVDDKCTTCGKKVARCFICNEIIESEKELEKCPFCGTLFHADHYKKWVEVRKYCPKCRIPVA